MRLRLLRALAGLTALTAAATFGVPGATAQADVACTPTMDTSSLTVAPTTVALGSTGKAKITLAATFTAPCGQPDAGDLQAGVILTSPGSRRLEYDATGVIKPTTAEHGFGFSGVRTVDSQQLRNADAGPWTTVFLAGDVDEDPAQGYDVVDGPKVSIVRAASLTAKGPSGKVAKKKSITISGKLTRANWESGQDGAYAKQSVVLQYRTKTGSYAAVKTVTSSSTSAVSASVKASKDGYYRFVFAGNSTTAAVNGSEVFVDVK